MVHGGRELSVSMLAMWDSFVGSKAPSHGMKLKMRLKPKALSEAVKPRWQDRSSVSGSEANEWKWTADLGVSSSNTKAPCSRD